jgi:hypothetical protein
MRSAIDAGEGTFSPARLAIRSSVGSSKATSVVQRCTLNSAALRLRSSIRCRNSLVVFFWKETRQRPDATRVGQHLHETFLSLAVEFGGQDTRPGRVAFRVGNDSTSFSLPRSSDMVTMGMVPVARWHMRVNDPPPVMMTSGPAFAASMMVGSIFDTGTSNAPTFKRFTPSRKP